MPCRFPYFLLSLLLLLRPPLASSSSCCTQGSESLFLSSYPALTDSSYAAVSEPDAAALLSQCIDRPAPGSTSTLTLTSSSLSSSLSVTPSTLLVVPPGLTLTMDSSLNVAALEIDGALIWTDATSSSTDLFLCAGYVAVSGTFELSASLSSAFIYIKNNALSHSFLGPRSFGAVQWDFLSAPASLDISGRALARTWSLLSSPLAASSSTLTLMHDASAMGWRPGDRILVAPTVRSGSSGVGHYAFIAAVDGPTLTMDTPTSAEFEAEFVVRNSLPALKSAEVINLSRNVVITGDDFSEVPCDPSLSPTFGGSVTSEGCACTEGRSSCTVGLHTVAAQNAVYKMSGARVEKCGQRGVGGK